MRSKKNIFYKGFVFVASLFAMMFLSQTSVSAAGECKVDFKKGEQYLTFAGSNILWTDEGFITEGCQAEEVKPGKVLVNGVDVSKSGNKFIPSDFGPGHYTIEYKYTINDQPNSIFRYVRILSPNFDTSKNYTLGAFSKFEQNGPAYIVNAFYDSTNKYIYNFLVNNGDTYVVITSLNGKEITRKNIQFSHSGSNEKIDLKQVIQSSLKPTEFYLVGNTPSGGVIQLVTIISDKNMDESKITKGDSTNKNREGIYYNGATIVETGSSTYFYLVGHDSSNHPIIDKYSTQGLQAFYTNSNKIGEYFDVIEKEEFLYAVGSYVDSAKAGTNGLYSIISKTSPSTNAVDSNNIIKDFSSFNKIIPGGTSDTSNTNIIVGSTSTIQILVDGKIVATNTKAGYDDAFIIEVNNEGNNILNAGMYGTGSNDAFNNIQYLGNGKYFVSGTASNGIQSLAYVFDKKEFTMTEDAVSRQANTIINGALNLVNKDEELKDAKNYGIVYYGKITTGKDLNIMGVYYPNEVEESDSLLLVLDNRKIYDETGTNTLNNEPITLTVDASPSDEHYKYCYYKVRFNKKDHDSKECGSHQGDYINAKEPAEIPLQYEIENETGGKIYIYRLIKVVDKATPVDLVNEKTGILKWYVYNRPYQYSKTGGVRLDPNNTSYNIIDKNKVVKYDANFKYVFSGNNSGKTIFDMIKEYFITGDTKGYILNDGTNIVESKVFKHSSQNTAAFSTIEYSKMFSYYQEFSRVIKIHVDHSHEDKIITPEDLGARAYNGNQIVAGQDFYIYYIDLMGTNGEGTAVDKCKIENGVVTGNCTAEGGYAFNDLDEINSIIKGLIEYNDYFTMTKNTIYNGSVPQCEIEEYKQILDTRQYLNNYKQDMTAVTKNLYFNVKDLNARIENGQEVYPAGTFIYQGTQNNVYFGGQITSASNGNIDIKNPYTGEILYSNFKGVKYDESQVDKYYQGIDNSSQIVITHNSCYEVYYTNSLDELAQKGKSKIFCLDTEGPVIKYHKENTDSADIIEVKKGNTSISPVYISSDFKITDIVDLDDYAYIRVNGEVFPNKCGEGLVSGSLEAEKSQSCLDDIEKNIRKTFRYSKANQTKLNKVEYKDRTGNVTTFYFMIGTRPPVITKEDLQTVPGTDKEQELVTSFMLTINFYETNSIGDFKIENVNRQQCTDDPSCFDGEDENTIYSKISEAALRFNKMVTNYIYAVSYRDRENLDGTITLLPDTEGIYVNPINQISYKVINGQFVEFANYNNRQALNGQVYKFEGENIQLGANYFVKDGILYHYEQADSKIYKVNLSFDYKKVEGKPADWETNYGRYYIKTEKDSDKYILNTSEIYQESITYYIRVNQFTDSEDGIILLNADNEFKFYPEDLRTYKIKIEPNDNYLEALPISYKIEEDNTFRITYKDNNGTIIYSYDPNTKIISYANPLISTSKKIEIVFTRTVKNGEEITGGVEIPITVPKMKKGSNEIEKDPITGLDIYTFPEDGGTESFKLVDGLYEFSITEEIPFNTNIPHVSATLYVTKLNLEVGHATDYEGLLEAIGEGDQQYELPYGISEKQFNFKGDNKNPEEFVNASKLTEEFNYPINMNNMGKYTKTYFMNKSVLAAYTVKGLSLFEIKVYKKRGPLGLPSSTETQDRCTQILIYGKDFTSGNLPNINTSCETVPQMIGQPDQATLKKYGIYVTNGGNSNIAGGYVFSGDQTFYSISLSEYVKNEGSYTLKSEILTEDFYIDSLFDPDTIGENVIDSQYHNQDGYSFVQPDGGGAFELVKANQNAVIGGDNNMLFNINFYNDLSDTDTRENKLMLVDLNVNGVSYTCNVSLSISSGNEDVANECSGNYINTSLSNLEGNKGKLVFSKSGDYKVTFKDASGNAKTYHFVIDKSAPIIQLDAVGDGNIPFRRETNGDYTVMTYVTDPKFDFTIVDDLSPINKYSYVFMYGNEKIAIDQGERSSSTGEKNLSASIKMSDDAIQILKNLKYDGNVILKVEASDSLTNKVEKGLVINFWVDFKAPTIDILADEGLNKDVIKGNDIISQNLTKNTITVLSEDYVNKTIIIEDGNAPENNIFEFKDSRIETSSIEYQFKLKVKDEHNDAGAYPSINKFENNLQMKFYEVTIDKQKSSEEFKFGIPTSVEDHSARWIYITVLDSVGNEAENGIIVPIIIADNVAPSVIRNGITKCMNDNTSSSECENWEIINGNQYTLKGDHNDSIVYAANNHIKVTFSEYISKVSYCKKITYLSDGSRTEDNCEMLGEEFQYSDRKLDFIFEYNSEDDNKSIVYKFKVVDFAGIESELETTILIDRIAPTIGGFVEGKDSDSFEYYKSKTAYDEDYNYRRDIDISEDQDMKFITVEHVFYRYAPKITYNNYIHNESGYVKVPDFELKTNQTYYYLVNKTDLKDKVCVTVSKSKPGYCFVEDVANNYYFDSLLNDNTKNDIQIWTTQGLDGNTISRIDETSNIGVYKVGYQVVDAAGNRSDPIYKRVFVHDTIKPSLDIQNPDTNKVVYKDVTNVNPNGFNGKINSAVKFVATDSPTQLSRSAKVLFYKCPIVKYEKGECSISSDELFHEGDMFGKNNYYTFDNDTIDGVYRAFAYDVGGYQKKNETVAINEEASEFASGDVYILSKNMATVSFAIKSQKVESIYTIHGNRFNSKHSDKNINYVEDNTNFIEIKNGDGFTDVKLIKRNDLDNTIDDLSGVNAIGYDSVTRETITSPKDGIKLIYKDANKKPIYEVSYENADLTDGFFIHKSYYYIDGTDVTLCNINVGEGKSPCELHEDKTYVMTGMKATIREDGGYRGLGLQDNYGNLSKPETNPFIIDNQGYYNNYNENKPTGINYWFSVPREVVNSLNYNKFNKIYDYKVLNSQPDNWETVYNTYYKVTSNGEYVLNTSKEFIENTYYERLNTVKQNVDVYEKQYQDNFNSNFFMAFASKEEASKYLNSMYLNDITEKMKGDAQYYTYTNIFGVDRRIKSTNVGEIFQEVKKDFDNMIVKTFTKEKKFDPEFIKQTEYVYDTTETNKLDNPTLYQYTYLLRTKVLSGDGLITYKYSFAGDSCIAGENQECIKVNLKIVTSAQNDLVVNKLPEGGGKLPPHTTKCVSQGMGISGVESTNCDSIPLGKDGMGNNKSGTVIYIDEDIEPGDDTTPHINTTYFGIRVYAESTKLNYEEVGRFIPIAEGLLNRYNLKEKVDNVNGDLLWVDNKWIRLSEIKNTNLYTNSCRFNGRTYNQGCVYTSFMPFFGTNKSGEKEPNITGNFIYNYYTKGYMDVSRSPSSGGSPYANVIDSINSFIKDEPNSKEIRYGFNLEGGLCADDINKTNCKFIPVALYNKTANLKLGENPDSIITNKNSYIEFFNTSTNLSKLFELHTIIRNGKIAEAYSYATLAIKYNNEQNYTYYNINDHIVHTRGYSPVNRKPDDWDTHYKDFYTKSGAEYKQVPAGEVPEWKENTYYINDVVECVLDLRLESIEYIKITDNASNEVSFRISHTAKTPTIDYEKENSETTNSNVNIIMNSTSKVDSIVPDNVKIYKYDEESSNYKDITDEKNSCFNEITNAINNTLTATFIYRADFDCSGIYKVMIEDNYGNSIFKEFVFNPYVIDNKLLVNLEERENKIHVYDNNGLIVNNYFAFEANSKLDNVIIYKYPAYSNGKFDLEVNKPEVVFIDFSSTENIAFENGCPINLVPLGFNTYSIQIVSNIEYSCDGVYKVQIENKFSSKLADFAVGNKFVNLSGNNNMILLDSKPNDWNKNYVKYFYLDEYGNYVPVESSTVEFESNKFYTQEIVKEFIINDQTSGDTVEIDSTAPDSSLLVGGKDNAQRFNIYLDGSDKFDEDKSEAMIKDKELSFTNTFVTIGWGTDPSYSFASLYYREVKPSEASDDIVWNIESNNVSYEPYVAQFEFAPTEAGVHTFEFKFVDAVGNEDGVALYTLEIEIIPPNVGLFEVAVDENGEPLKEGGSYVAKNRYADGQRIPKQAILKCIDDSDSQIKSDCKPEQYDYYMKVNGNSYDFKYHVAQIISKESPFLFQGHGQDYLKDELAIDLIVTIKGKKSIATELRVIIDRKAPEISISGTQAENTTKYVGSVEISVDSQDLTNEAYIYKCDLDPLLYEQHCYINSDNGKVENEHPIGKLDVSTDFKFHLSENYSGYFLVVASDDPINLGNKSRATFTLDNEAPIINVSTSSGTLAPNMYTNSDSVKVTVFDELTTDSKKTDIEFTYTAFNPDDKQYEGNMIYDSLLGFTKEGKYVVTPIDEVGHKGQPITFYIYRQKPKFNISGGMSVIRKNVQVSWDVPESDLIAPVVNATIDGKSYNAVYSQETNEYMGEVVTQKGQHTFVLTDAAGNRSVIMVTISDTNKVCINGHLIEVKMQAYRSTDKLYVGHEEGVTYNKDDVIIYGLPTQTTGTECTEAGALGYRTLDEQNSFYWIKSDKTAESFNKNTYDFVRNGFISKSAIEDINNIGGTVVVFVVTKDIANNLLGYKIGTNFFLEDPLGWSIIFVGAILCLIPSYRIFVKKKVRVI